MENQPVVVTFKNLSALDIKTLQGAVLFQDLCTSFIMQGVQIDGIPSSVEVDYGTELDNAGTPLTNSVRVRVVPSLH